MLQDREGQGYTEYIVLLGSVLAIAGIVYAVVVTIGQVYERQQGKIESLDAEWGP